MRCQVSSCASWIIPVRRSLRLIRPGGSRCGWVRSARATARRARRSTRRPGDQPSSSGPDGWFSTGDEYLRDAEGFYHHRGRTGDMLRVSGIWISPAEIEDALAGHASVAESAAVLGESDIGLAEDRALCRAGGGRGWRRRDRCGARAVGARRCRATSSRGGSRSSAICRARRPARSSATSCASNCGAIRIDGLPISCCGRQT